MTAGVAVTTSRLLVMGREDERERRTVTALDSIYDNTKARIEVTFGTFDLPTSGQVQLI